MKEIISRFSFNRLDNIVAVDVTQNSFMATVDLLDAYCSVPIHPVDRMHFGLRWDFGDGPAYLTYNFLCFRSKCSAFKFNRLTDSVAHYMTNQGFAVITILMIL